MEIADLTERVSAIVRRLGVREGLASVCSMHTTCTVFVNEFQRALTSDMKSFLEQVVDSGADWLHNDPAHSDCDRANADAHLRAMLLPNGLTLQVHGGDLVLGQWQRVLLAELDGPRERTLRVQVMGV
jgi:secondary thiamine-phosphate synthase enzyme